MLKRKKPKNKFKINKGYGDYKPETISYGSIDNIVVFREYNPFMGSLFKELYNDSFADLMNNLNTNPFLLKDDGKKTK